MADEDALCVANNLLKSILSRESEDCRSKGEKHKKLSLKRKKKAEELPESKKRFIEVCDEDLEACKRNR